MPAGHPELITVSAAAQALGVSRESVRQYAKANKLVSVREGHRVLIRTDSLDARLAKVGRKPSQPDQLAALSSQVERLAQAVDRLERRAVDEATGDAEAVALQRDRYRAEAATMRDTALQLQTVTREATAALRQTLAVLEAQSDALGGLLAPGSPHELLA